MSLLVMPRRFWQSCTACPGLLWSFVPAKCQGSVVRSFVPAGCKGSVVPGRSWHVCYQRPARPHLGIDPFDAAICLGPCTRMAADSCHPNRALNYLTVTPRVRPELALCFSSRNTMVGFMCPEPIDSFCLLLRSSHEALRKRGRSRQALQSADGSSEMVVEELRPFGAAFDLQGQVCVCTQSCSLDIPHGPNMAQAAPRTEMRFFLPPCLRMSPAAGTQIKKGDVLVAVDGVNVSNMEPSQLGTLRHDIFHFVLHRVVAQYSAMYSVQASSFWGRRGQQLSLNSHGRRWKISKSAARRSQLPIGRWK